eukprot:1160021-Pelagomonas_calceolata.AAC.2
MARVGVQGFLERLNAELNAGVHKTVTCHVHIQLCKKDCPMLARCNPPTRAKHVHTPSFKSANSARGVGQLGSLLRTPSKEEEQQQRGFSTAASKVVRDSVRIVYLQILMKGLWICRRNAKLLSGQMGTNCGNMRETHK